MYIVYSKPDCVWCDRAKQLLESKGLDYQEWEIYVESEPDPKLGVSYMSLDTLKQLMPQVKTLPQIFRDSTYIGGFKQLDAFLNPDTLF